MAVNPTVLEIKAKISGLKGLNQLKSSLRKLGTESVNAENTLKGYTAEITKFAQKTGNSINSLEAQKKAFEALRRSVDVTGDEFKQAGIELDKLDKKLAKAEGRKQGGGRLRGAAQIAGTVAGAGVFGGPEGAIGAAIGAIGGPAGSIVGGAIGAQVGAIRKALGATAEYAANLKKLRIALLGVTTSNEEYARSLQAIEQGTKDYAIPQDILTRQFTKLQASVQGAGGNLDDTKTAFNGIVAAVRATGGSLQDVDSALTATSQVFSKGKVSAEELRQQIGERLPGAFSIFAKSIGKTPQELDKALEGGKVSLQDFQTFAKALLERYGENAKIIASGPESAGDRLKISLSKLSESIGTLLAPIGTAFLKTFEEIVKAISAASTALNNFLGIGTQGAINKAEREFKSATDAFAASGIDYREASLNPESLSRDQRRKFNRLKNRLSLTKTRLDDARAAGAVADIQRPDEGTGLPGIGLTAKETVGGKGRTPADKRPAALEKLRRLMLKVSREFVDIGTEATKIGANARTKILLEREQAYQKVLQQDQDRISIIRQVSAVTGQAYEDEIAQIEKLKRSKLSIINRQVDEQLFAQRLSEFGMDQKTFDQNSRAITGLDQQAFPTGVDSILNPNKLKASITEMKKGLEELTNPANQVIGAATAIGDAFANSFKSVINGSATAQQALASFFQNIGSYFLDMAAKILAEMIKISILNAVTGLLPGLGSSVGSGFNLGGFGSLSPDAASGTSGFLFGANLSTRANGGPVSANTPYVVGERGRELFIPRQSGSITNNDQFEAARKAMGGAKNSSNDAFAENAEAIGVSTSYTKERVMERERIASINSNPIDVRTETTVINNVEYVTAKQFAQGMQSTARDAQARVLSDLRNRPATRAQVGIR
jgi:tape measure domain-containing protein